jgi:hypothetical protein
LLIIGIQDPNRAIAPKIIAKIPKTLRSSFIMKPLSAFNVDQLLHIFYFRFTKLFLKWKQLLSRQIIK